MILLCLFLPYWSPTTPVCMHTGLGSSRFARRYSGNRCFFLFLQVLRCFSSLRLPRFRVTIHNDCWVPPFGNLWINAYLQLPKAYRCSSRPSSAPSAKAFTVRPLFLNHFLIIFNMIALFFVLYLHIDSVNFSVHYIFFRNYNYCLCINPSHREINTDIQFSMNKLIHRHESCLSVLFHLTVTC